MESASPEVDGRPILPNPEVSEPYFSVGIPKTRGLLVRSRTHLVLLRRELEGAVLPPPGRQQKPAENTEFAWGPQPEPAELKCTKGTSLLKLCLLKGLWELPSPPFPSPSSISGEEETLKLAALLPAADTAVQNVALSPRSVLPFCENGPL